MKSVSCLSSFRLPGMPDVTKNALAVYGIVLCLIGAAVQADRPGLFRDYFKFTETLSLPPCSGQESALGVAGPFAGVHKNVLIIAGGANFEKPYWENRKVWHDDIWILGIEDRNAQWITGYKLSKPLAYGASVSTDYGVVCIGGNNEQGSFAEVFLLAWDPVGKTIRQQPLPSLPGPCSSAGAAIIGNIIYVAGGLEGSDLASATKKFWSLNLTEAIRSNQAKWENLPPWPGPARAFHSVTAQHNGKTNCIYVIGGRTQTTENPSDVDFLTDVYEFSPDSYRTSAADFNQGWRKCTSSPRAVCAAPAVSVGQSHIAVFGGDDGMLFSRASELKEQHPGFSTEVLAYHTITDTWIPAGRLPYSPVTTIAVKWNDKIIIPSGEVAPRIRTPRIVEAFLVKERKSFGILNFVTLGIYLAAMVGVGVYFTMRNKNTDDFFRGGQRLPGWAAGLSIFATMLSSITFIAIPAKVFSTDWTFFTLNMMAIVTAPFVMYYILPFFRRIDATSAYEYLEKRFNYGVRLFAALSFVLFQIGRMAIVMYLPSLALSAITSLTIEQCILIIGILSVIYCTLGGLEAVVWTDSIQSIVLLGGAALSLCIIVVHLDGNWSTVFNTLHAKDKLNIANWDFSLAGTALWIMVLGGLGQSLVPYVSDQGIVQRYLSTTNLRSAKKSILINAAITLPASLIFFAIGTALFLFYNENPQKLDPNFQNDAIFPLFIAFELPMGISGIVVAGIFAAAQSTVSTSMNSISTVLITDFIRRFSLLKTEKGYLHAARFGTFFFGVLGTLLALLFASADIKSLWDSFISVLGLFGGSMCGLFLLGIFTTRVHGHAAISGAVIGAGALLWIQHHTNVSFLLYATLGISMCMLSGYIFSFIVPQTSKELSGLTIHTLKKDEKCIRTVL